MILPKEKLHVVYLFMPLRPMKSRAAILNSNSLNSVIFAELELELELGLANISRTRLKMNRVRSPEMWPAENIMRAMWPAMP